jgi:predicted nucleic acid-binding Zn ribbon protein
MISVDSDARAASYHRMADEIAAAHGRANIAHEQRCNRIDADRKTSAEQKAALRKTSNYQRCRGPHRRTEQSRKGSSQPCGPFAVAGARRRMSPPAAQ